MATFFELWYIKVRKLMNGNYVNYMACHVKLDGEEEVCETKIDELISDTENKRASLAAWIDEYTPTQQEEDKLWGMFAEQYGGGE